MPAEIPKNTQELFDKIVPEGLAKHLKEAKAINAIYCFQITGDNGGIWTFDLTGEVPTCTKGDGKPAQVVINVANKDFLDMLVNPQIGMNLYFQGKLKVTGDPALVGKLQHFFALAAQG